MKIAQWAQDPECAEYFRRFPPFFVWDNPDVVVNLFASNSWAVYNGDSFDGLVTITKDNAQDKSAELGTCFESKPGRLAVARDAMTQLIDYIFNYKGYNKISCLALSNRADIRKELVSQGFVEEGYFKENCFFKGEFVDEALFSLLKKDWK